LIKLIKLIRLIHFPEIPKCEKSEYPTRFENSESGQAGKGQEEQKNALVSPEGELAWCRMSTAKSRKFKIIVFVLFVTPLNLPSRNNTNKGQKRHQNKLR